MTMTDSFTAMTYITNGIETPVVECEVHCGGNNRPAFVNEPGWTGFTEVVELVDLIDRFIYLLNLLW
jgi:hypothetical protein